MTDAPGDLQTVAELIALVEMEPDLRIVLTEGRSDALFFGWYLEASNLNAAVVAVSDRVYVPRDAFDWPAEYGEREKLNYIAETVNSLLPASQNSLTLVLDSDWMNAVGPVPLVTGCRLYTDFPSVEFYFLEPAPWDRFVRLGLQRPSVDYAALRLSISDALRKVAAARLALAHYGASCVERFAEICSLDGTSGTDIQEIVRRSLNASSLAPRPQLETVVAVATGFYEVLCDAQHPGRGHDVAPMIIAYLHLKNELAKPAVVERLMRSTSHHVELKDFELFKALEGRVAA